MCAAIISSNQCTGSSTINSSAGTSHEDSVDGIHKHAFQIKKYIKDLLKSRIFLGRYVERRLADPRIGYRDIVVLSPAEVEMKRDLIDAQNKLRSALNIFWIGITDAEYIGYPPNICLWTEIDNQPFGPFWFQIKSVKYREEEVILTLKCIRYISESYLEIEPILMGIPKKDCKLSVNNADSTAVATLSETYNEIAVNLKTALTIRNVKEFLSFLVAFVIAIFTGSTALVNFIGNFVLALIREISVFVKNSTPLLLGFLEFFSKIVGGFYILLAMFFRPSYPKRPSRRVIDYNSQYSNDKFTPGKHSPTVINTNDRNFDRSFD